MLISGITLKDLKNKFDLSMNELSLYLPISNREVEKNELEVRYLGYYLKWDQQGKYYFAVEKGGFVPSQREPRVLIQNIIVLMINLMIFIFIQH